MNGERTNERASHFLMNVFLDMACTVSFHQSFLEPAYFLNARNLKKRDLDVNLEKSRFLIWVFFPKPPLC